MYKTDMWESQFFDCAIIDVMQRKLSTKERKETVNKGYLEDQDYTTKDWVFEMFESFERKILLSFDKKVEAIKKDNRQYYEVHQKENRQHMESLMEENRHNLQAIVEVFDSKIERIHRQIGMTPL